MVANSKVRKVMHEFKTGTLHSGKGGKVVRSRQQAIAIAMSEAGKGKNMSVKGEKYKSASAKMKHEKSEGKKERMMEYGKKAPVKKTATKKVTKKGKK